MRGLTCVRTRQCGVRRTCAVPSELCRATSAAAAGLLRSYTTVSPSSELMSVTLAGESSTSSTPAMGVASSLQQ